MSFWAKPIATNKRMSLGGHSQVCDEEKRPNYTNQQHSWRNHHSLPNMASENAPLRGENPWRACSWPCSWLLNTEPSRPGKTRARSFLPHILLLHLLVRHVPQEPKQHACCCLAVVVVIPISLLHWLIYHRCLLDPSSPRIPGPRDDDDDGGGDGGKAAGYLPPWCTRRVMEHLTTCCHIDSTNHCSPAEHRLLWQIHFTRLCPVLL